MNNKTRLSINLDSTLKDQTAATLANLGLDFTTAINLYFRKIVNSQSIPFEISAKNYYSVEEVAGADWREGLEDMVDEWE